MVELLLPAGNKESLRAAVKNGADAVYLGLERLNARMGASNFNSKNIASVVDYCHGRNVKVYVVLNTLVKNSELNEFFRLAGVCSKVGVDAVIVQDMNLVPILKSNYPTLEIHASTQAAISNTQSIPENVSRVVLPREMALKEIKRMSAKVETEVFVHGALCVSYSGKCLFSSIIGRRSGNRGMCAQPCRKKYNNKYAISTMDLCMVDKIPELIKAGVKSFKVEGRLRSPEYVGTVARIYRKVIDGGKATKKDLEDLKVVFNREFTSGFAFNKTIIEFKQPMNRGLYLGKIKDGKIRLRASLGIGDGIAIWTKKDRHGFEVTEKKMTGKEGDIVSIKGNDYDSVYKTKAADLKVDLAEDFELLEKKVDVKFKLPAVEPSGIKGKYRIYARAYSRDHAIDLWKAGADVIIADEFIYDDVADDVDCQVMLETPKIADSITIEKFSKDFDDVKKVLIGDKGFLKYFKGPMDYHNNIFNDYGGYGVMSPELSYEDLKRMKNKGIVLIHGEIVLMTLREPLRAPELVDESNRHFNIRKRDGYVEILNSVHLGLFCYAKKLLDAGYREFLFDCNNPKYLRIYRDILDGKLRNDSKFTRGFTIGNFLKGVI